MNVIHNLHTIHIQNIHTRKRSQILIDHCLKIINLLQFVNACTSSSILFEVRHATPILKL